MADNNNATNALQQEFKALLEEQNKIAEHVKTLKANKAPKPEIDAGVEKLKEVKAKVEDLRKKLNPEKIEFPRQAFSRMLTQRFFIAPSFEIYGGVAGLYDLGPPGTAIKANILNFWRQHFILNENMLEVDTSCVTPEPVLKTSGHTAKFCDLMVKDVVNGSCYRADHLLEQHLDKLLEDKKLSAEKIDEYKTVQAQADAFSAAEMAEMLKKYQVKAPETNNDLSHPEPFNLMFKTSIGPTGLVPGFLRPETAQGIFVNFKRLLEFNGGRLPFAAAQIGQAYRNEIAPRSGLLRVREFTLAEIEHFVNPDDKKHPKFASVANTVLTLFPRDIQTTTKKTVEMTIGDAVAQGIVANETLGYFMVRVYLFLIGCGVKRDRLRFRQHLRDEMAHYATDCWDAEIQNSYGWTECVGIADRSCYDLSAHANTTNIPLTAFVEFPDGPRQQEVVSLTVDKAAVGKKYGKQTQVLLQYLDRMDQEDISKLEQDISKNGTVKITTSNTTFELDASTLKFKKEQKRVTGRTITPGVIEPSFGIGRILYSVLEHAYWHRENDEQRAVLSLPPAIAPVKVSILPHMAVDTLVAAVPRIAALLADTGISHKIDDSGATVGKRYARTDEIGIPYAITIDYTTLKDDTVTLRERDTTAQVRIKVDDLVSVLTRLISGKLTWADVESKFPKQEAPKE